MDARLDGRRGCTMPCRRRSAILSAPTNRSDPNDLSAYAYDRMREPTYLSMRVSDPEPSDQTESRPIARTHNPYATRTQDPRPARTA
jgi:hypothetical protein